MYNDYSIIKLKLLQIFRGFKYNVVSYLFLWSRSCEIYFYETQEVTRKEAETFKDLILIEYLHNT